MADMIDTAAIESLRGFALANNELAFAHMCTAALQGETWAVERVTDTLRRITAGLEYRDADQSTNTLDCIRATNTTRPDGAVARAGIEVCTATTLAHRAAP
jgi:hypothetical protein